MKNPLSYLLGTVPDDPFYQPRKPKWLPEEMTTPPPFPDLQENTIPSPWSVLLINPFYPKDPHASFGKHVLTPTLALTSLSGATPRKWEVRYRDENLLQPVSPDEELPQVVGITVHLTFSQRAFALADWFRAHGSTVILGGLHVQSCPEECMPHADAIVVGDGVQLWQQILHDIEKGELKEIYEAQYEREYNLDPPP
jgi:hypothetical protein